MFADDLVLRSFNQHFEDSPVPVGLEDGELGIAGHTVTLFEVESVALMNLVVSGGVNHAQGPYSTVVVTGQEVPNQSISRSRQRRD
jgi:hypothetical protein